MGNLKNAIRAQWRPDFDLQEDQGNIVKKTVVNLVTLVGLIVLIAVTFALASRVHRPGRRRCSSWLGLTEIGWLSPVLRFVADRLLHRRRLGAVHVPVHRAARGPASPGRSSARGALMGAIGLGVLQYSTGLLFNLFGNNKAASIFGPVIVLMLFFNIFAQLILFVAAWIATATQEAVPVPEEKVRFALTPAGRAGGGDGAGRARGR